MKILIVLISLITLSCTLPVIRTKARPRRQISFGGMFPFFRPIMGINPRLNNVNPVIHIPDPPRPRPSTNTATTYSQLRPPDCRVKDPQNPQNPGALFLIPSSDPRGSPQAFLIPSLSGNQNTSNSFPTQIFVLPPSSGQSFGPGSGQLVPPIRPESSSTLSGGQAPVIVVPGVFLAAPDNRPAGGVSPWSGQYPGKGVPYQNGGPPFTSGGGQYPAGNSQYPTGAGQYPNGGGQYPAGNTQYPNGGGQYPNGGGQYPASNGQYPASNGQYPNGGGQYPAGNSQYPSEGGQYPPWTGQYPSTGGQYPPEQEDAPGSGGLKNWQ
ncbi:calcium-binding protein P-like [Astyanax mexicanus]|uniref:calcium-binding protein P-like n=1 Tax=Astyanax mexicanus TaxID=7994 RepID=UPI0020CAB145|nr:calcium-binding protein P-like [Astyanax mexicanus]